MFMSQLSLPLLSISASSTDALGLVADTPLDDEGNKRFKQSIEMTPQGKDEVRVVDILVVPNSASPSQDTFKYNGSQTSSGGQDPLSSSTNLRGGDAPAPKDTRFWLLILAIMFTTFLGALDLCSIPTVLPTIAKDLNATSYIWVANAYMLTSVAFIPTASSLAHIFGRRATMLGALSFFAVGSAICGAAPSMKIIIIGRSIQGVGSGSLMAICQIVLADLTSLAERGTFLGLSGLVYSMAAVFGPLIGGGFAISGSWRWLFYMNLPFVVIAATLCGLFLKVKVPQTSFQQKMALMDWVNFVFVAAASATVLGLSLGGATYPWKSWRVLLPLVLGLVGIVLWLYLESIIKHPTVPWEILRHRTSLSGYIQTFLQAVIQICFVFYLTIWFQSVQGSSALRAAVQTFTLSFTIAPMAIMNGIYVKKTQSFVMPCIVAWAILTVGCGLLTLIKPTSGPNIWASLPVVPGIGVGILGTGVYFPIAAPLPPKLQPHAAGFFILVRVFGQLIGVTIAATIFQNELLRQVPTAFLSTLPNPSEVAFSAIPTVKALSEPLRSEVRAAFSDSIKVIWYTCIGLSAAGLAASFLMEHVKMSTQTHDDYGMVDEKNSLAQK